MSNVDQDDYLTDFEVIKMKQLYQSQLDELVAQTIFNFGFGAIASYPLFGPMFRSMQHSTYMRLPIAVCVASFMSVQMTSWGRPNRHF